MFAKYGGEGVRTHLVTATRGELGWFGPPEENPGPAKLGKIREAELMRAARVLGIGEVNLLDYQDGELDRADQQRLIGDIVGHIRRVRPHVIVTMDQNGLYGHPDHIAATRAATGAAVLAASPDFKEPSGLPPHTTLKLYYYVLTHEVSTAYQAAFGELVMQIDGVERRVVEWPDWAISTWVDTSAHWKTTWEAVRCHASQLPGYQKLLDLPDEYHEGLWGKLTFSRLFSLVAVPAREDDLFAGLR